MEGIRSITVHDAVFKGEREITIYIPHIVAVGHDGTTDKARIDCTGGQSYRVHESYDKVMALIGDA
jgi:hypothetical protein